MHQMKFFTSGRQRQRTQNKQLSNVIGTVRSYIVKLPPPPIPIETSVKVKWGEPTVFISYII